MIMFFPIRRNRRYDRIDYKLIGVYPNDSSVGNMYLQLSSPVVVIGGGNHH